MGTNSDYYKIISAIGKAAMRERAANGERMYRAPLGWKIVRDAEGRARLEKDPAAWPLVEEARRLYTQGMSVRGVCREMHSKGLSSKNGKRISPGGMHLILTRMDDVK